MGWVGGCGEEGVCPASAAAGGGEGHCNDGDGDGDGGVPPGESGEEMGSMVWCSDMVGVLYGVDDQVMDSRIHFKSTPNIT